MARVRRQLTLFLARAAAEEIERLRMTYNPEQSRLIPAHVTLCRDAEVEDLEQVRKNLGRLSWPVLCLEFGPPVRFEDGKGLWLAGVGSLEDFWGLREAVLKGIVDAPARPHPHITLMHPRNSTCTDAIFEVVSGLPLPRRFWFKTVAYIEQVGDAAWRIVEEYPLVSDDG